MAKYNTEGVVELSSEIAATLAGINGQVETLRRMVRRELGNEVDRRRRAQSELADIRKELADAVNVVADREADLALAHRCLRQNGIDIPSRKPAPAPKSAPAPQAE